MPLECLLALGLISARSAQRSSPRLPVEVIHFVQENGNLGYESSEYERLKRPWEKIKYSNMGKLPGKCFCMHTNKSNNHVGVLESFKND